MFRNYMNEYNRKLVVHLDWGRKIGNREEQSRVQRRTYLGTEGPCPPTFEKKPFSIQTFIRPPLTELPYSKIYLFCFVFFFLLLCPFLCLFNRFGLVHLIFISCFIRLVHVRVINEESNFYNPLDVVFYSFDSTTFKTRVKLLTSTFLHIILSIYLGIHV